MKQFNVRVYGLLINSKKEILVSDERRNGFSFTKFPGGGLEFGEGVVDALIREFSEELAIDVSIGELFYVNDFFQLSAFNENHQLLSFYYFVNYIKSEELGQENYSFPLQEEGEKQRCVSIDKLKETDFTFPIDKIVIEKIKMIH